MELKNRSFQYLKYRSRRLFHFPTGQCSSSPSWWHRGVFVSQYTTFHLPVAVAAQ